MHAAKRTGDTLEGIHIFLAPPNGQKSEIIAESGTMKSGTPEHPTFENQITITLHNAKTVTPDTNLKFTAATMAMVLYQPGADDQKTVLPGRHMSERQVADIALKELPQSSRISCEFKDGVWEISEPQKGVWGTSSATTNANGKITITSTNATKLVLRVRDLDGTGEQVNHP